MISILSYFSAKCHKCGQLGHYRRDSTQGKAWHSIILIALANYYSNKKDGKERYRIDVLHVCIGNE